MLAPEALLDSSVPAAAESRAARRDALLLAAYAGLLFFVFLGRLPLFDLDESRYARGAQEMVEGGDWIVPHLNGEVRLAKPAFFYWLVAGSTSVFGMNEFAARLPSALAALGVVLLVHRMGLALFGRGKALAAGLVFATSALPLAAGRLAVTDMTLVFFETAALTCFAGAYFGDRARSGRMLGFWTCCGLAFFMKGPVGEIVPLLVVVAFLALRRDLRFLRTRLGPGLALFLLAGLPWYLAVGVRFGWTEGFRKLTTETVDRFVAGGDHPEPVTFFLPVLFAGFFPWSLFLAAKPGLTALARLPRVLRDDPRRGFLAVWVLVVLVFFSLGRGKLPTYVLPAFPPLALLFADYWEEWSRAAGAHGWRGRLTAHGPLLLLAVAGFVAALRPTGVLSDFRGADLVPPMLLASGLALGAGLARRGSSHLSLAAISISVGAVALSAILVAGDRVALRRSSRDLAREIERRLGPGDSVATYHFKTLGLLFYLDRRILAPAHVDELAAALDAPGRLLVVTKRKQFSKKLPADLRARMQLLWEDTASGHDVALFAEKEGADAANGPSRR